MSLKTGSQGTVLTSPLKRPKSALWTSKEAVLLTSLLTSPRIKNPIISWLLCPRWLLTVTLLTHPPLLTNSRSSRTPSLVGSLTSCVRTLFSTNTYTLESSPCSEDFTIFSGKAKSMNETEREVNLFALCQTLPLCTVPHFQTLLHRNGKHS